jgi:hypothetical protein
MLAPLIFDSLTVALLFLLLGWASDAFRASMHDGSGDRNTEGSSEGNRLSRSRPLRPAAGSDATWTTRPVRRHSFSGRPQTSRGFDPEPAGACRHSGLRTLWPGDQADLRSASWRS